MAEFIATTGTLKRRRKRLMVWGEADFRHHHQRLLARLEQGSRMLR